MLKQWNTFGGKVEPWGENFFLLWNVDLMISVTASKRRRVIFNQSFLTDSQFDFYSPLILPSQAALECNYGPLHPLFDCVSVNFWWSLTRMILLISYPMREPPYFVPSVVVLYSFFPAVASTRYTQCSTLGDAIFNTHIWGVKFLQSLRCNFSCFALYKV